MQFLWLESTKRNRTGAISLAAGLVLLTGCGQQVDLYDYFGDDKPAASQPATVGQPLTPPGQNVGAAQPANALAGNTNLGNTDDVLANARADTSGIKRVSLKNAQGVAVTVDDLPVTNFDISQRINLENALGARMSADLATRKRILGTLVNEKVAKSKAGKAKYNISDNELDERIKTMTDRMKVSTADLNKRLGEKGVNQKTLKNQIEGTLYIRWVMAQQQVKTDIKVDQAKVDAKYNEIMSDPRMKPVTVIYIQQVDLPVEKTSEAMRQQLLYARAIEARQIMQRYKGCKSIRSASRDIFNVKVGKRIEADMGRLPKELQNALRSAGTRKMIGPIPGPTGVRLFANCGTRKIEPPRPDRKQIEASVRNEQFEQLVEQAMAEARKESFIDYKDPTFKP
jgi:peptidyl-prolyl cis-trans isomerase SurA